MAQLEQDVIERCAVKDAEIERLKAEAELFAKHTGLTLAAKDTLLRQALEALEKTRAFHQQDWSSEEITPKLTRGTIAAIKQHLGKYDITCMPRLEQIK